VVAEVPVPFGATREASLRSDPAFARLMGDVSQKLRAAAA
jgi:hypothetical protein